VLTSLEYAVIRPLFCRLRCVPASPGYCVYRVVVEVMKHRLPRWTSAVWCLGLGLKDCCVLHVTVRQYPNGRNL